MKGHLEHDVLRFINIPALVLLVLFPLLQQERGKESEEENVT